MTEPTPSAMADEIERLMKEATPIDEHHILLRYDHGGGRLYRYGENAENERDLIADLYGEGGNRELLYTLWRYAPALITALRDVERLSADLAQARKEAANWENTAAQFLDGQQYYRGLVVQIGKMLGDEVYTQDDGGKVDEPLCAKVPEVVEALIKHDKQMDTERAYWKEFEPRALAAEAENKRLREALEKAPIPSKYHGMRGFELDRFLADYEAFVRDNIRHARSALSAQHGGG